VEGETVRYSLTLDLEVASKVQNAGAGQAPLAADHDALARIVSRHVEISADGNACAPLPGTVQPPLPGRSIVVIVVHYACAAPVRRLTLRDNLSVVFGRDHHTLASIEWPGGTEQVLLDPDRSEAHIVGSVDEQPARFYSLDQPFGHDARRFRHDRAEQLVPASTTFSLFALILGGGRSGPPPGNRHRIHGRAQHHARTCGLGS
jgi:hypothetical protein